MFPAARIFAALSATGEIRFVGDVPRGAACNCFCSVCGGPLLAKQGTENVWHFSHEARQERPECVPGAVNLLRRLMVQHLQAQATLTLPRYEHTVSRYVGQTHKTELIQWGAQPRSIKWADPADSSTGAIASMSLDNGIVAELSVDVCERPPIHAPHGPARAGSVLFWTYLPDAADLRTQAAAERFIQQSGRLTWIYQPDVFGLIEAAQRRLSNEAYEEQARTQARIEREHAAAAARRQAEQAAQEKLRFQLAVDPEKASLAPLWARVIKSGRPYFGYDLGPHGIWVVFELEPSGGAIRRLDARSGWQADVPPHVGRYDATLDLVICTSLTDAQATITHAYRGAGMRVSSNFQDLLSLSI